LLLLSFYIPQIPRIPILLLTHCVAELQMQQDANGQFEAEIPQVASELVGPGYTDDVVAA